MAGKKKVNYLNNKDLLKEIHKSKLSHSWLLADRYFQHDVILMDKKHISNSYQVEHPTVMELDADGNKTDAIETPAWTERRTYLQDARENQAKRLQAETYAAAVLANPTGNYKNRPKQKDFYIDPKSIKKEDVVFRVHTFEHIPLAPDRKREPKKEADFYEKVNFPPFKQYAYIDGKVTEVARSHRAKDDRDSAFDTEHGELTGKLGMQFLMLVERYSRKSNWRGYTYVDEMRGQALLQLSQIALQFDESKSDNPFAYYTATVNNSFTRVLNIEKRNQDIRDNILIDQGHLPSYGRQLEHEASMRAMRDEVTENATGGDI